ncbi:hypothetical protein [Brevibacillus borstelensis]|uniref:hypothetical protein n=1 Tax=Brevibacillus borstelensis TaxID=45462 RepID=UPI0030C4106E
MKNTNSIFNSVSTELKYQVYSHVLTVVLIISIALSIVNLYGLMKKADSSYTLYLKTYAGYEQQGMDVEEMLKAPLSVDKTGHLEMIDNPIRYNYEETASALRLLKSENIMTQTLEWMSFIFFPLIFALYGIYISAYDYKYRTIKAKIVRTRWDKLLTAKLLSLYLSGLFIILCTLAVSYAASFWFYQQVVEHIPVEQFSHAELPPAKNVVPQFLLSIGASFLFATIGFILGLLFRGFAVPMIIFFVYDLIVPVLGAYDIRNLIAVIAHELFDFKGRFQLFTPLPVPSFAAIALLFVAFIISLAGSYLLFLRQGKYTS